MKRIQELDALRGSALYGILLVNIFVFHAPLSCYGEFYGAFKGIQLATVDVIVNFAGGKFLFIFAFLFGFGISLQKNSRAIAFTSYFYRRMLVLFVFGTLHILFFWFGDILASYALLGLLCIPLLRLSDKKMLLCAIFLLLFRPIYYLGVAALNWPMTDMEGLPQLQEFIRIFQEESYYNIFELRMKEFFAFIPENLVWYLPKTLGLFLLGIYAARKKLFEQIKGNRLRAALLTLFLFTISLLWIFYKTGIFNTIDLKAQPFWRPALIAINTITETTQGLSYIIGFSLLLQYKTLISKWFGNAGRLALSNYILQSCICVFIFYSYGLGYYGRLKPIDLVLIATAIYMVNLVFSTIYLRYKSSGPLEYLWRKLIKN